MKPLEIEDGVPVPDLKAVMSRPRTRAGLTASLLKPGQSTVATTQSEFNTIRKYLHSKGYKSRSEQCEQGWRIWRVT